MAIDAPTVHQGRNLKRIREMLGIKQESLARNLGPGWSQKRISLLEAREELPASDAEHVAQALGIPATVIPHFNENVARDFIEFMKVREDAPAPVPSPVSCAPVSEEISPVREILDEYRQLYERLVEAERNRADTLESILIHTTGRTCPGVEDIPLSR